TMFHESKPDPRIAKRGNTKLWHWRKRGNTATTLLRLMAGVPDVYFFPREGPLDQGYFEMRRRLRWHTAVVTYIVSGGLDRVGPRTGQLRNLHEATAVVGNCRHITSLLNTNLGFSAETIYDGIDRRYYFPAKSKNLTGEKRLIV